MPGKSYQGPFLPLNQEEQAVKEELKEIVTHLADVIGERNIWHYQNLTLASEYISYNFRENGFSVNEFSYLVEDLLVKNIMVQIKGNQAADEIVVIGAHYDTVLGSPGADDNASGVAALLVLAKLLAKEPLAKTVHFVAFVNEEMPFFYTKNMGSFQYAKKYRCHVFFGKYRLLFRRKGLSTLSLSI
jgi:acetylornithine deacetylase/succinyl-diaminopimelate desuccinylase-like protein